MPRKYSSQGTGQKLSSQSWGGSQVTEPKYLNPVLNKPRDYVSKSESRVAGVFPALYSGVGAEPSLCRGRDGQGAEPELPQPQGRTHRART